MVLIQEIRLDDDHQPEACGAEGCGEGHWRPMAWLANSCDGADYLIIGDRSPFGNYSAGPFKDKKFRSLKIILRAVPDP
ncbi:MAG: hypothetical protein HY879_23095 [Deltaproteobacteria bacterium]|nr:hypothetical protein [Deltaproteobacteria bacterium]